MNVLITGANTGIGKETARQLLHKGARVIMACRSPDKAEEAYRELRSEVADDSKLQIIGLDLASLASVKMCAQQLLQKQERINVLINNAGVMACPYALTEDGFEMQFGVNHMGHFLLTNLLLPVLLNSTPSRIVTLSSHAHYAGKMNFEDINSIKSYNSVTAYCQSKLANVLFSQELARRLRGTGVSTYSVHPGVVATQLGRHITPSKPDKRSLSRRVIHSIIMKTPSQGARTTVYCATSDKLALQSGFYYSNCHRTFTSPLTWNTTLAKKLWLKTEQLLAPYLSSV